MKRLLFSLFAISTVISSSSIFAEDSRILDIRAKYNATENASLKQRKISLDDGPESAELVKYYNRDGILVKMKFSHGGDHGFATEYYYIDHGNLYFVFKESGFWQFNPKGPEGSTIDTSRERRVYYSGNKVIRHLIKEATSVNAEAVAGLLKQAGNQKTSNPEIETMLLTNAQQLLHVDTEKELEKFLFQE